MYKNVLLHKYMCYKICNISTEMNTYKSDDLKGRGVGIIIKIKCFTLYIPTPNLLPSGQIRLIMSIKICV